MYIALSIFCNSNFFFLENLISTGEILFYFFFSLKPNSSSFFKIERPSASPVFYFNFIFHSFSALVYFVLSSFASLSLQCCCGGSNSFGCLAGPTTAPGNYIVP